MFSRIMAVDNQRAVGEFRGKIAEEGDDSAAADDFICHRSASDTFPGRERRMQELESLSDDGQA